MKDLRYYFKAKKPSQVCVENSEEILKNDPPKETDCQKPEEFEFEKLKFYHNDMEIDMSGIDWDWLFYRDKEDAAKIDRELDLLSSEEIDDILSKFDQDNHFGPSVGILIIKIKFQDQLVIICIYFLGLSRIVRYNRACKLKLNPDPRIPKLIEISKNRKINTFNKRKQK